MWIETMDNRLLNLEQFGTISIVENEEDPPEPITFSIMATLGYADIPVVEFRYLPQALHAMDRLKKWIEKDGLIQVPADVPGGSKPHETRVFSFRTLSEDDEFKKEAGK